MIFGFEENHSTEQICLGLTLIVQKGTEWPKVKPVYILSADVKAAFDNLTLDTVLEALIFWNFPLGLIAALLEESLELEATASV